VTAKDHEQPTERDRARPLKDWLSILVGVAILLVARASVADHYHVPSGSMQPSVEPGDRVAVHKAAYGLRIPFTERWLTDVAMPARGDVVILRSPETGEVLLKRVVAVAGDQVAVRAGQVWIDGRPVSIEATPRGLLEELGDRSHPLRVTSSGGPDLAPVTVPPGQLLVMGDNRGNSHDGRSFGFVEDQAVLGRAVGVFYRGGAVRWIDL